MVSNNQAGRLPVIFKLILVGYLCTWNCFACYIFRLLLKIVLTYFLIGNYHCCRQFFLLEATEASLLIQQEV